MKITLHDGRVANFPGGTKPHVVGKTIARMMSPDGGKSDTEAEEKAKKDEKRKEDEIQEVRHKEKIAVGLQGVKASQERNKAAGDHVKATKEAGDTVGKTIGASISKILPELAGISKSLANITQVGKEIKELKKSIDALGDRLEDATKLIVSTMGKPKKLVRSERGALTGIRNEE